jgi:hypothetical protein
VTSPHDNGGKESREQVPLPVAAALGSDASHRAVGQYHLVHADPGRSLEMMGAPPSNGSPLTQKACAKVCPFLHSGVTRIAPSIPLLEHNGTALIVQSSLSCSMTHSLCSDHMRGSFLAASCPTTNSPRPYRLPTTWWVISCRPNTQNRCPQSEVCHRSPPFLLYVTGEQNCSRAPSCLARFPRYYDRYWSLATRDR